MKKLIYYRLYDKFYGENGNPKTLVVILNEDSTLSYSFYGGWQSSGMGFCISNLQMKKSLPIVIDKFKDIEELEYEISSCLRTGYGSNDIKSIEKIHTNFPKGLYEQSKEIIDCYKELVALVEKISNNKQSRFITGNWRIEFNKIKEKSKNFL